MEEKFVYLMHASDEECELYKQRLVDVGIDCRFEDYSGNAFFRIYGAKSGLGKKVLVPETKLSEAKALLNIGENEKDNFVPSSSKRPMYKVTRILIIASLLILFGIYIASFISNTLLFF